MDLSKFKAGKMVLAQTNVSLRALAEENAGAPASFVANLFRARPLKKTIEL